MLLLARYARSAAMKDIKIQNETSILKFQNSRNCWFISNSERVISSLSNSKSSLVHLHWFTADLLHKMEDNWDLPQPGYTLKTRCQFLDQMEHQTSPVKNKTSSYQTCSFRMLSSVSSYPFNNRIFSNKILGNILEKKYVKLHLKMKVTYMWYVYNLYKFHNVQVCLSRKQQVSWSPLELGKVMFAVQTHHNTGRSENQEIQMEIK